MRGAFVILFASTAPTCASAKDLSVLVRVAYTAFLADQGSAVCAGARLDFSSEDTIAFKNAKNYARRIKQRISIGLRDDDVKSVLLPAADRARAEVREAVKTFHSETDLFQWCTATVTPLARQVVGTYMRNRNLIEEIIQKAKGDTDPSQSDSRKPFSGG